MKLKIEYKTGYKHDNDRKILVTTEKREPVTIFKVALLVNQIAVNELEIHERVKKGELPFFYKEFIGSAIEDAENEMDWANKHNEHHVKKLCEKYLINTEAINPLLHRTQSNKQRTLEEFGVEEQP